MYHQTVNLENLGIIKQLQEKFRLDKKNEIIDSIQGKRSSAIFWSKVLKFIHKGKFPEVNFLLEKYYELKIREKRQLIGATGVSMGLIAGGKFSLIGNNIAEPSDKICSLLTDILMYSKFKLIALSKNTVANFNHAV